MFDIRINKENDLVEVESQFLLNSFSHLENTNRFVEENIEEVSSQKKEEYFNLIASIYDNSSFK